MAEFVNTYKVSIECPLCTRGTLKRKYARRRMVEWVGQGWCNLQSLNDGDTLHIRCFQRNSVLNGEWSHSCDCQIRKGLMVNAFSFQYMMFGHHVCSVRLWIMLAVF